MALLTFTTAMTFLVAALNVRYRDVQHLLGLGLLVWFWMTPIVYQGFLVQDKLQAVSIGPLTAWQAYLLNPAATIVFGFQQALYEDVQGDILPAFSMGELGWMLGVVIAVSTVLLYVTWRLYFSMSGDFAEEL